MHFKASYLWIWRIAWQLCQHHQQLPSLLLPHTASRSTHRSKQHCQSITT
jgi:hypothetical protein